MKETDETIEDMLDELEVSSDNKQSLKEAIEELEDARSEINDLREYVDELEKDNVVLKRKNDELNEENIALRKTENYAASVLEEFRSVIDSDEYDTGEYKMDVSDAS